MGGSNYKVALSVAVAICDRLAIGLVKYCQSISNWVTLKFMVFHTNLYRAIWVVPPKSIVGGRLREKSTVGGRLREKKGRRRRGKEERRKKKEERREEKVYLASSSPARRRRLLVAREPSSPSPAGRLRAIAALARDFSPARGERSRRHGISRGREKKNLESGAALRLRDSSLARSVTDGGFLLPVRGEGTRRPAKGCRSAIALANAMSGPFATLNYVDVDAMRVVERRKGRLTFASVTLSPLGNCVGVNADAAHPWLPLAAPSATEAVHHHHQPKC
ncbi:hypothetical protein GW17_00023826 [Ensete ventricosum]|nr:hypothetical protein GW17_00023826 [Ensete ventricosum]